MTDNEAIKFHLTNFYKEEFGSIHFSGFYSALKDARKITGRNMETGAKDNTNTFGDLGSWLGAVGYLSLLDQIGNCFKKVDRPADETNKSGIIKALKNFSNLTDDEIGAIYALRISFAHDYSLQNTNDQNPNMTHHFYVYKSDDSAIVVLPKQKWDGKSDKTAPNRTYINLQAFGDMTEKLISDLIKSVDDNKIEIILDGGKDELIDKYSFVAR